MTGRIHNPRPDGDSEAGPAVERAILVAVPRPDGGKSSAREHLAELERLADTAGAEVVGEIVQILDAPRARYYLGSGKARKLAEMVGAKEAELVVFDDELTPAQARNLEKLCGVRVLDRTELILDIFATRARSYEARLQVELAQLQYLLPRLRRMWVHLSRIRGGIGLRGPGETQLEVDRRLIGRRIADLRRKLAAVSRAEATRRKGRADSFRATLVGYTNTGKSSLLQALSGKEQNVEDRLFATLDASTRLVDLGDRREALVTDTVGFIRKLPHHLVASFRSTLAEACEADLLLHVVDASHPQRDVQAGVVRATLAEMGLADRAGLTVYNKVDLLGDEEMMALRALADPGGEGRAIYTSALAPATLEPLRSALRRRARERWRKVRVWLPVAEGRVLAALYEGGDVLSRTEDGSTVTVVARASRALIGRLRAHSGVRVAEWPGR